MEDCVQTGKVLVVCNMILWGFHFTSCIRGCLMHNHNSKKVKMQVKMLIKNRFSFLANWGVVTLSVRWLSCLKLFLLVFINWTQVVAKPKHMSHIAYPISNIISVQKYFELESKTCLNNTIIWWGGISRAVFSKTITDSHVFGICFAFWTVLPWRVKPGF